MEGLRSVVRWNPCGAQSLLAILKEYPAWVKYKDDPYGPLSLILFGVLPRKWIGNDVSVPIKPAPFPEDRFAACAAFGNEWKQRRFTKKELADEIEKMLKDIV